MTFSSHPAGETALSEVPIETMPTHVEITVPPMVRTMADWKENEVQTLPNNNLWIVFPGILLAVFLVSLDITVVGIVMPTIARELGTGSGYAWVGSSYLFAAGVFSPLWGILSDVLGRKPLFYFGLVTFLGSSALCGASQSIVCLICARFAQGVGAGAMVQMTQTIIGDIVTLQERAKYQGAVGSMSGVAAALGPLVGGLLTTRVSWRWVFWINLPTGVVSGALVLSLRLNPRPRRSLRRHISEFDFVGLGLITGGIACLLLAFTFSQTSWSSPITIALLTSSGALCAGGITHEFYTRRHPIIPPRIFKTRTTLIILFSVLVHAFAFFATPFYLPLYFQSQGSSVLVSGYHTTPYSMGVAVMTVASGWAVSKLGAYRAVLWFGWGFMTLGYGLMLSLDGSSNRAQEVLYPFIAAVGAGCLLQTLTVSIQAAMPLENMATVTATVQLMRLIGGTVGISCGEAVYVACLQRKLDSLPEYEGHAVPKAELINNAQYIAIVQPPELRDRVMHAYAGSLSSIWLICTPLLATSLVLMVFIRGYSLKRTTRRATDGVGPPLSSPSNAIEAPISLEPTNPKMDLQDVLDPDDRFPDEEVATTPASA